MSLEEDAEKLDEYLQAKFTQHRYTSSRGVLYNAASLWEACLEDYRILDYAVDWASADLALRLVDDNGVAQRFYRLYDDLHRKEYGPQSLYLKTLFDYLLSKESKVQLEDFL